MALMERIKEPADLQEVERGMLLAVAYADVFDYPLTLAELQRYLIGVAASPGAVAAALHNSDAAHFLDLNDGFVTLAGRSELVAVRRERMEYAALLWQQAIYYGKRIARMPFVRMVALTGALAMDNVKHGADIDYLIVTEPGRLWLCRALIVALVRLAAVRGHLICPNYLLSERALQIPEQTLYTAHELAQMVPLAGIRTYTHMRLLNRWSDIFLPNAGQPPEHPSVRHANQPVGQALAEAVLRTPLGGLAERYEMQRKVRKLGRLHGSEAGFCEDWCKGHFEGHGSRTMHEFERRCQILGVTNDELRVTSD